MTDPILCCTLFGGSQSTPKCSCLKRVLPALAYHPSAFSGSNWQAEKTTSVPDLPEHKISFPSKVRKGVPLGWLVMLGYFSLKLIIFQKISPFPPPTWKSSLEKTQEFAKHTNMYLIRAVNIERVFSPRVLLHSTQKGNCWSVLWVNQTLPTLPVLQQRTWPRPKLSFPTFRLSHNLLGNWLTYIELSFEALKTWN